MCDYEIQQAFIRDIEWIQKTKDMVKEKQERQSQWEAKKKQREEIRKKVQEEKRLREEQIKKE